MTDQEFYAWCQISSVGSKRQITLMLVNFCVRHKFYREAAQIVSGSTDIFNSCSLRINDMVASLEEAPKSPDYLQLILEAAREEVTFHQLWASNILYCARP